MNLRTILLSAVVILLLLPSTVLGQVQTRVRIIEASNYGQTTDPSLRDVHDQLGSLFNFSCYKLLRDINLNLAGNRPMEVIVHKGKSMEITLIGEYRNMVELKIRILRDRTPILNTQVRLTSGRTILIGGPRREDKAIILAISGRF